MAHAAAVIGGGPAGLMAAEVLAQAGLRVTVYDHMPSMGRKMLMAGRGGLNLTHSEPLPVLLSRYGAASRQLAPFVTAFPPAALVAWSEALGVPTFVGSSGRVFPVSMKASPLLRAWLRRLGSLGVVLRPRHRWIGWGPDGAPLFDPPAAPPPDIVVLACGGASWPRLGSDGAWVGRIDEPTEPWGPSNCGFSVGWSAHLVDRFAGRPLKRIVVRFNGQTARGDAIITATGLEGTPVYALSGELRRAIAAQGQAMLTLDLRPDLHRDVLALRLDRRGSLSLANALRRHAGLSPEAAALVQEALHHGVEATDLAGLIKAVPVTLLAPAPIERAISSAGGLRWDAVDAHLMLHRRPGVFAAGEMLDWEAPTGGYLLQACFSTGAGAAHGALAWLKRAG